MPEQTPHTSSWLVFALMTVLAWGLYGPMLHAGAVHMMDPENGRLKAFLIVGVAYLLTAVLAPLAILLLKGAPLAMPMSGMGWSLLAGVLGALGALCVLLAFGAKGHPSVVMSIVFAGAPIINAVCLLLTKPPEGGLSTLRWQFVLGVVLAAVGGSLVTLYKPDPAKSTSAAHSRLGPAKAWGADTEASVSAGRGLL